MSRCVIINIFPKQQTYVDVCCFAYLSVCTLEKISIFVLYLTTWWCYIGFINLWFTLMFAVLGYIHIYIYIYIYIHIYIMGLDNVFRVGGFERFAMYKVCQCILGGQESFEILGCLRWLLYP